MLETNLKGKCEAFGAQVIEINGHDFEEIVQALYAIQERNGFQVVLAHTIKGKGISFMEQDAKWQSRILEGTQMEQALDELNLNYTPTP